MKTVHHYLYTSLALVASAGILLAYLSINNLGGGEISSFPRMLEGSAFRPSIYRVLMPALAKAGASLVPSPLTDFFRNLPPGTGIEQAFDQLSGDQHFAEAVTALGLMYSSIVAFILVEKRLLQELAYSLREQLVLPIVLAVLILPFSVHFAYVYDLPQVLLFAAGALCLYRRQWTAYLILLAIALLNKETSFFLIVIFAICYFQKLPGKEFLTLLGAQAGLFVVLRAVTVYVYRNNPGVPVFWSFQHHIDQYTKYPSTLLVTLVLFGAMIWLMLKDWQRKPLFLRRALIVFPFTLVLFFLAGMPMEFRVFLDGLPVFGILLFPAPRTVPREEVTSVMEPGIHSNL